MNLLVTGGCGFIGSNFINYMLNKYPDINIVNLDAMYYSAKEENVKSHPNYTFIKGNLNDYNFLTYILNKHQIDTIVNFAAQSHVDLSFTDSLLFTRDNVLGTHTLLEAIYNTNSDIKLLHFSTDEVYGETKINESAKTENSALCPTNPYAASKAAAEMYVNSYIHSYKLKAIITRCNNVYGPNQYPEKLIPKFIQLIKNNQKCTIHGNGETRRSYIHVDDVCAAVDLILHKGVIGEIYNIPSRDESEKTVMEISKLIINKLKPEDDIDNWIEYVQDRPFNDYRYFMNGEKLTNLGWEQKILEFRLDELL